MPFSLNRSLLLASAVAAAALPLLAEPAEAQSRRRAAASNDGGVSIVIRKQSNYLNTRTIARPRTSQADYQTSALYQSTTPTRGGGFSRYPLPSPFDLPGF